MLEFSMTADAQRHGASNRPRRIAVAADISAELIFGGTRIPLPAVPFAPVEPLRTSGIPWRGCAGDPVAAASPGAP